jgi:hypothetical protein
MITRFFVLVSVTYWFVYVEPSLHPYNETNLIMLYDLFYLLLNSACKYFIENFTSVFIKEIILQCYFFIMSLSSFKPS